MMKGGEQENVITLHLSKQILNLDRFRHFYQGRIAIDFAG